MLLMGNRTSLFADRSVLVTGGTGSFGRCFTQTLLALARPRKVIIFSRDELKQHEMAQELDDPRLRFFLGDVRDRDRLVRAFDSVDFVVHAAALKQVPSCEYNPFEAVKTNILGAQNLIEAAIDRGVGRVVALSSDKAANPINLYGATKLCADKLFVAGNTYAGGRGTAFSVVRYGNVVGSRGSVLPLFLQRRSAGRIPVTDRRMTRFWITLKEAVEFVIRCFDLMRGGEIFVPKIRSMRVVDLARAVAPSCAIDEIGIRPGEKLHEVMIAEDDARHCVEYEHHYVIQPAFPWWRSDLSWNGGRPVPEGFSYSSDKNTEWLDVQDLRSLLEEGESNGLALQHPVD